MKWLTVLEGTVMFIFSVTAQKEHFPEYHRAEEELLVRDFLVLGHSSPEMSQMRQGMALLVLDRANMGIQKHP